MLAPGLLSRTGMHPLLVSAVASTAGNFLDRWARGAGAQPAAPAPADFQTVLDGKTGATAPASAMKPHPESPPERLARLRSELVEAPEIRAVLDTADPAKPAMISLTPDGRVLSASPGREPQPILLSPQTAAIAQELAGLTAARGGDSFVGQVKSVFPGIEPRSGTPDPIPQTGLTALR